MQLFVFELIALASKGQFVHHCRVIITQDL
jgi:hypothetical protein